MIHRSKIFSLIAILALLIQGCSAGLSSIYDSNYPLSKETAKAKSSPLTVKIPQGWFSAEDNEKNLIDLWLVKGDYSASLNFTVLSIDTLTRNKIQGDDFRNLVTYSQAFRKARYGKSIKEFINQENFEIGSKQFSAYEYADDTNRMIRVVLFRFLNKYYELSAFPLKSDNPQELYKIQNSVLNSIN